MLNAVRILIVEDDPQDAALAEREIRRVDMICTVRRVDTHDGMVAALRDFDPDVILTDHSLPNFSARDALRVAHELAPRTPVIVVTGRLGDESAVEYLQAGAADYVVKDHLQQLGPAVLRALETKRSREAQSRAQQLQAATYRIAQLAINTPALEDLLPTIHQIVGELMPAKNFYIALYDPATELLSFPYFVDEQDTDFSSRRLGKGLTDYVLRTGRPLLVTPEVQAELESRGEVELIGAPSIDWVGVPLRVGERTIGVLVAQTYAPGIRYGERDRDILQFVSTQVAMAIERSRAATELRASEGRLNAIIDAALDAVITMDGDGVLQSWSRQAERMFGWSAGEAVGRRLSATIIPPRYREAHELGLARFLASGEGPVLNRRIEITGLHRDGREIPVELTITPVQLGGQWLFSAFVRDISDRQQADRRRAAQYAVTRALAEAATLAEAAAGIVRAMCESLDWQGGALWVLDAEQGVLRCVEVWHVPGVELGEFERATRAHSFARGVGLPGEVWATGGLVWHRDVTALAAPRFPRAAQAAAIGLRAAFGLPIRSGATMTGVLEFFSRELREPDSDLRDMSVALGSQIGQFIERRRAEAALRASEERFRDMAEHIEEAFFDVDLATGKPLYVSPTWSKIWGRPLEEGYDAGIWFEAIHPDDRGAIGASQEAVRRGEPRTDVFQIVRPDGTTRWVRGRAFPVRDATGQVHRMVGVAEDITDLRSTEEQLRQAQKMEAIGRLAGGIAHDFNNILTAMFGYCDLLRDELPEGSSARQDTEEIRKAGHRAAALTRQLLAFSRQQVLEPVVLNPNDLVADVDKMLRRVIGEDVELRVALARDLGNVRADPGQMQQVLLNLAVNARDAMPTGGKLLIETANVDLAEQYAELHPPVVPGRYVMLAVTDTGVGMDAQTKAKAFEPFFTTKGKGKGTGLGLSTVYGIVKQSGGYIWVYSEVGRGTTFKVYLPRVDAPAQPLAPPRETGTLAGTETILLAEDDEMLRPLSQGLLEKLGYQVLAAENATQALALAGAHVGPIHVLVADVVMPGASGRELARRLAEVRPDTKVLFVSGYTDDAIVHHGMLEPRLNFLQKPFTPDALARKVREVLDAK
jgi:two-component system, cell cycle sensor histidine kinase and response regulator CckA